jgi:hypothetical protein
MKYDKLETNNHSVNLSHPCCNKDFNQILLDEDDSLAILPNVFNAAVVIDLDCVEVENARNEHRNQNRTMDVTFAISDTNNLEMLLVELRFNYKNLANLNRIELLEKVDGSTLILGNTVKVNGDYIFIFQPHLVQQAINRLQRMNPRIPNNYIAMDLSVLVQKYF